MASWCVTQTLRRLYWNNIKITVKPFGYAFASTTIRSSARKITNVCRTRKWKDNNLRLYPVRERLLFPQHTFASDSESRTEDEFIVHILNSPSIDEIFDLIDPNHAMSPPQVYAAFAALDSLLAKHINSFSWALTEHPILSCLQSFINNESKGIYQLVQSCPEFESLCYEAVRHQRDFSNYELLSITLSLFKLLRIDLDNKHFVSLLTECLRREESFNVNQLAIYCDIANLMKRNGFSISSRIINMLMRYIDETNVPSETEFKDVIKILNNVGYFITGSNLLDLQNVLYSWASRHKDNVGQIVIVTMMETLSRFASGYHPLMLDMVYRYFETKCRDMSSWELLRLVMLVKASQNRPKALVDEIAARADRLINGERLRASDFTFLAIVYEFLKFPGDSREKIENLLTFHVDEIDVILLRYLSVSTIVFTSRNPNFLSAFYRQVWNRKNELYESVSCLLGVIHCLTKIPNSRRSRNLDSILSRELLNFVLEDHFGQQPSHVSTISSYVLKCIEFIPPNALSALHQKLVSIIPNCSLANLIEIGLGLPNHLNHRSGDYYPLSLCRILTREAVGRKEELKGIKVVNLLMKNIIQKLDRSVRMTILPQIVQMYNQNVDSIDLSNLDFTVKHISFLRLYLPDVFERIIQVILNNSASFTITEVARVMELLATFDHRSDSSDMLGNLVIRKVNELGTQWSSRLEPVLSTMNSLATLQIFPRELIDRVFKLDFLSMFDATCQRDDINQENFIKEKRFSEINSRNNLLRMLMQLNRSLLLQCPYLPVPWICSKICNRQNELLYEMPASGWKTVTYEGLAGALGGSEFINVGPLFTPFGHLYDFEFLLDATRNPVPLNSDNWHFRVAVLLQKPTNYSSNCNRLLGPSRALVTQLEILGYIVLQVPYYKLDEMKCIAPQKRMNYFKDLIFNSKTIEMSD